MNDKSKTKGITMLDLNRITHPLRLAAGSHEPGSGKGCAMNVISYINGDTKITDFPECSARPLARMVQIVNDRLAGPDGFLSPEDSVTVLDLGWLTVGTAGAPRGVVWQWLADILADPERGVVRYASAKGAVAVAVGRVAELCVRQAGGERVSTTEWHEAANAAEWHEAANAAAAAAAAHAANAAAAAAHAANAAAAAAHAAATAAAYAHAHAAAHAAATAATPAAADAAAYAAIYADARTAFTRWAIQRWRDLMGLDQSDLTPAAVDSALEKING